MCAHRELSFKLEKSIGCLYTDTHTYLSSATMRYATSPSQFNAHRYHYRPAAAAVDFERGGAIFQRIEPVSYVTVWLQYNRELALKFDLHAFQENVE